MRRVPALFTAEFLQLQPVGAARLLLGAVVPRAADRALQPDVLTHGVPRLPPRPSAPRSRKSQREPVTRAGAGCSSGRAGGRSLLDLGHDAGADRAAALA